MPELLAVLQRGFGISAPKLVVENKEKKIMAHNIVAQYFIFRL